MRHGKSIAAALCAGILAATCAGCGKSESADNAISEPQKGRWVETEEILPEELEEWTLQELSTVGNEIRLTAVKQENGETVLSEWALGEDGFTDVTQDWLSSVALPDVDWLEVSLLQDGNGVQYLYAGYAADGEEDYKGHLWKGSGTEARDITPEKWTVPNPDWGMYERLVGMAALEDGKLVCVSYTSIDILSGEDGSVLQSEPLSKQYEGNMASDGEHVYLCAQEGSGCRIEKRKGGAGAGASSISFPTESSGIPQFCVKEDSTMVAAGPEGLFSCQAGQEDWEKLLDGSETDFALTELWCTSMAALEDGRIYGLFRQSGGGAKLNRYEYDPDAVIEVKEHLKLYSVYESSLLQQASVMYHREHPEVLITIDYTYPSYYYDETDYNAVYQELNTRLMGEDAPDILVMDHLDMDSFIDKGLLVDIGNLVEPLEESGALLSGVTGAYAREDGSRYIVPLQFGFYMALGRDIGETDMASLEALADFLSKKGESYLGPQTTGELVDRFYPYFCRDIVMDKQLDKEALSGKLECLKAIADNCGMIESREKDERAFNVWDLASGAKLALEEANGFKDCMFPLAMADYIQGRFTAYEDSFIPSLQTGICAKSPYQETAKDFLRLALSASVQDTDYYKGFPVNLASLEKQAHEDRTEAQAETTIEADGGEVEFIIRCYPDEIADRLLAICKGLDSPMKEDGKIREVLIESLDGYLKGTQDKETALQKIEDGLKMYLAE